MHIPAIKRIIYTEEDIKNKVAELGAKITSDYSGKKPVFVSVSLGTTYFLADLTRRIDTELNIEFMLIGVYPETSKRTGVVKIIKDLDIDVEGRHVIMIEDIINTGLTMGYLVQNIESRKPASIKICTLLDRRVKRLMNIPLEYTGFVVPDIYLVGYGLDYEQEYRHLPYIAEFDIDKYNKIKDKEIE